LKVRGNKRRKGEGNLKAIGRKKAIEVIIKEVRKIQGSLVRRTNTQGLILMEMMNKEKESLIRRNAGEANMLKVPGAKFLVI
jgi:hypothetical protein